MNNPKVRKDYRFPGMDRNKPLVLDENYCVTTSEESGGGFPVVNVPDNFKSFSETEITDETIIASLNLADITRPLIVIVPDLVQDTYDYYYVVAEHITKYSNEAIDIAVNLPSVIDGILYFNFDPEGNKWYASYQGGSSS